MNKNEIPFVHIGLKKLKGLKYPIRIFRVKGHYDKIMRVRHRKKRRAKVVRKLLILIFIIAILGLGFYLFLSFNIF